MEYFSSQLVSNESQHLQWPRNLLVFGPSFFQLNKLNNKIN